jgi:hypothetical protein
LGVAATHLRANPAGEYYLWQGIFCVPVFYFPAVITIGVRKTEGHGSARSALGEIAAFIPAAAMILVFIR